MMGWQTGAGWGSGAWLGMSLGMVAFWVLLLVVVVALVRWAVSDGVGHGRSASSPELPVTPVQILDQRFARGEISEADYTARRDILQGR